MDIYVIACAIFAVIGIVASGLVLLFTRPRCPECNSLNLSEISKEPLGMRDASYHSGGGGGGYSSTQIMYLVKFRCNECQEQWNQTVSETR